jgi:hypothetical protein
MFLQELAYEILYPLDMVQALSDEIRDIVSQCSSICGAKCHEDPERTVSGLGMDFQGISISTLVERSQTIDVAEATT